jgi:predicted permease
MARLQITASVGAGIGLAYVTLGVVGVAAWATGRWLLRLPRASVGALVVCCVVVNTGFLGLPLVAVLLGADDLGPAIAYDTLVSGPMLYVFGFAVGALFGTKAGVGARQRLVTFLKNPPLIAVVAGLLAPDVLAPHALADAARYVTICLLPIGFFVLGVNLAAEAQGGSLAFPPAFSRAVAAIIGLRMVLAPALLAGLAALTIAVPHAYLLQAAMPSGINCLLIAHVYGLDVRLTSSAVAWTTTVAVVAGLLSVLL